ncbi:MAG: cellulase family glycosylhydrolase, partial [Phycisphaerae bacterium]|nr:cellulase family glycosylhydrolase [Phycisphaerae bacterium]
MSDAKYEMIARFWETAAKEFKDEPRIAMFQILNEPTFPEGQCRPEFAERVREITKDMIRRIRKHDKRHIILVSDWNVGWGWATESQWKPVNFDPGDPRRQVAFSKHVSGEHCTEAFMAGGVDRVADLYDVPMIFDEVENNDLMMQTQTAWFYNYLYRNPRKYSFAVWVCGQYWPEFPQITAAFANAYLPPAPFPRRERKLIVDWTRADKPDVSKSADKVDSIFTLPEKLPVGDYGIVLETQPPRTRYSLALKPDRNSPRKIGAWIGAPGEAKWQTFFEGGSHIDGASIVPMAMYFHALEPFEQVVIRCSEKGLQGRAAIEEKFSAPLQPDSIQLFRLNSSYQMPLPKIETRQVK